MLAARTIKTDKGILVIYYNRMERKYFLNNGEGDQKPIGSYIDAIRYLKGNSWNYSHII